MRCCRIGGRLSISITNTPSPKSEPIWRRSGAQAAGGDRSRRCRVRQTHPDLSRWHDRSARPRARRNRSGKNRLFGGSRATARRRCPDAATRQGRHGVTDANRRSACYTRFHFDPLFMANARLQRLQSELASAKEGVFLGDGANDAPYSQQQRDRLLLRRQEFETTALEGSLQASQAAAEAAEERKYFERLSHFDLTLPANYVANYVVWSVPASPAPRFPKAKPC